VRWRALIVAWSAGIAAASAAATPFRAPAQAPPTNTTADTTRPAVTLLYQNFPNPFPAGESRTTCIWFDLSSTATVSLTIHDVRGNLVRRILPNAGSPQFLSPGRYGRGSDTANSGCDPAFAWDGRADDGATVPRGVYLIRLRAGGVQSIKKAVFQGP
jgi:flagellar hook assembly protein FlgD